MRMSDVKPRRPLTDDEENACGERAAGAANAAMDENPWPLAIETLADLCWDLYRAGTPGTRQDEDSDAEAVLDLMWEKLFETAFENEAAKVLGETRPRLTVVS